MDGRKECYMELEQVIMGVVVGAMVTMIVLRLRKGGKT